MNRFLKFAFPVLALALMISIYVVKYESWHLQREVRQLEAAIEREKNEIVILRAELAYLTRPERIERLARKHLKMRPLEPAQIVVVEE
jgi:cell division protein FtsL